MDHNFREVEGGDDHTGTFGSGIDTDALAISPKELANSGIEQMHKIVAFKRRVVWAAVLEQDARSSGAGSIARRRMVGEWTHLRICNRL
jgi:hypothetical protein